jgi:hypothetical protein
MKTIAYWVISVHVAICLILLGDHWIKRDRRSKQPIHIRMFEVQAALPLKTIAAPPLKTASAPQPSSKPAAKPKKVAAPSPPKKSAPKPLPTKKELSIPVLTPVIAAPDVAEEKIDPSLMVASYLKDLLILPEIGDVKVHLVINKQGVVEEVEILESKSQKNQDFLKNRLSEIAFPWLNEETKLTLVFRND